MCDYAETCKRICNYNLAYNFVRELLPLKSAGFLCYIFQRHGNETFPKGSSENEIVPLLVIFHLPCSSYRGVKRFLLLSLSKSKIFTGVALVSLV